MADIDVWNALWESLFFGNGSWLGILIIISIIVALLIKYRYVAVLTMPITILWGIEFLNRDLGWQALIMFLTTIFTVIYITAKRGR